jgi:hypothetical protein
MAKLVAAYVTVEVGFEDGTQVPFSVSPTGRLSPCDGDAVCVPDASHWEEASDLLHREYSFTPPSAHCSATVCVNGRRLLCWPWDVE